MEKELSQQFILYDGMCNFCNTIVNFVKKNDKRDIFLFLPIQTKDARKLLRAANEIFINLKTVYLVDDQTCYKKSRAIFKIFAMLPYPWKSISWFRFLPLFFTDFIYGQIARHRYKIFGQSKELYFPDKNMKETVFIKDSN
jgi:predicted DCC family thiol-disulfide oxidoreductase YuxK